MKRTPPSVRRASAASGKWRAFFSFAAAVFDLAALGVSFLPVGGMSCGSSATTTPGQPTPPPHEVCRAVPTITAFQGAVPVLALMIALGLVPVCTLRTRRRWPSTASAVVQTVLQFLGLGAFLFWVPAWLCTIASAAIPPEA